MTSGKVCDRRKESFSSIPHVHAPFELLGPTQRAGRACDIDYSLRENPYASCQFASEDIEILRRRPRDSPRDVWRESDILIGALSNISTHGFSTPLTRILQQKPVYLSVVDSLRDATRGVENRITPGLPYTSDTCKHVVRDADNVVSR